MNRISKLGLAGAAMALAAGLPAATADTTTTSPDATPPATPTGWGGTNQYGGGVWVHQDFIYDDYGADTGSWGQPNVISLSATSGDYRYPAGTSVVDGDDVSGNDADIRAVHVEADGADLIVRVELQTLVDADVPALYVVVDDKAFTATSDGLRSTALLAQIPGSGASPVTIDPATNTIVVRLPGQAAGDSDLSLFVGAGLHDGDGGLLQGVPGNTRTAPDAFTTGASPAPGPAGALFDAAFNVRDPEGLAGEDRNNNWNEDFQSAALAAGDLESLTVTVPRDALDGTGSSTYEPGPGYHIAVYESDQDLGEGMADSFPHYRGTHQPYAVWIPASAADTAPETLWLSLHSLNSNYTQYHGGGLGSSYNTYYEQIGDRNDAVVVTPLGRGPDGWYENEALVDTLEVWSDVINVRFPTIDPDQVHVGGYSMGGYGTYRLTTLMPDTFASAEVTAGPMTNGIWAYPLPPEANGREDRPDNTYHQMESARHVPVSVKHGTNDELVPVAGVIHNVNRMADLGREFRFDLFPGEGHLSLVFTDDWELESDWMAEHPTRVHDPAQVTLDIRPSTWIEQGGSSATADADIIAQLFSLADEVGADLRGGYWVDDVTLAEGDDPTADGADDRAVAQVDLTSLALAADATHVEDLPGAGVSGDLPRSYVRRQSVPQNDDRGTANALVGSLTNVGSLTVDVQRAGLTLAADVSGITVDGCTYLTLVDTEADASFTHALNCGASPVATS